MRVAISWLGISLDRGGTVNFGNSASSLAVILSLALPVIPAQAPQTAQAPHTQESTAETSARKVRTKTAPEYPALARQLNVTGKVKLEVTISADGRVTSTRTVGGSPLLVPPATEAVKKWRYEPGPKETTEIVEFSFSSKD
jgi:TonB family protein